MRTLFIRVNRSAWLALALGLLLTILVTLGLYLRASERAEQEFALHVRDVIASINERILQHEEILLGGAGLFDVKHSVTRSEWHAYVERLALNVNYPGILGVGYSQVIRPADLKAHIARIRAEGFPDYTVHPEGTRDLYTSIIYLEPFAGRNLAAFGYDMFSQPIRAKAMRRAGETGRTTISGKVTLVQETLGKVQAGFLMYVPIYRDARKFGTADERWANLQGFVYSPYRMDDLMRGILGKHTREVNFTIYDGMTPTADALMYESTDAFAPDGKTESLRPQFMSVTNAIDAYGHTWTVSIRSNPQFEAKFRSWWEPAILVVGSGVSFLLFVLFRLVSVGRDRASQLTSSAARMQAILNTVVDGIITIDARGIVKSFNPSAERIFAYAASEVIGRNVKVLMPEPYHSEHDGYLERYGATGEARIIGVGREVEGRRKDGSTFSLDLAVNEMWLDNKRHFTGVVRDITERKRIEEEIRELNQNLERIVAERTTSLHKSERRFVNLFELAPDAVVMIDAQGHIKLVNRQAEALFGYSREELVGQAVEMLIPEGSRPQHVGLRQGFFRHPSVRSMAAGQNLFALRKDGSTFPADISLSPVESEEGTLVSATVRDVTVRTQAEAAIQQQQEFLRLMTENLAEGVVACNGEGVLNFFNKTARAWHGVDLRALPPEEWAKHYDLFEGDGITPLATDRIPLRRAFAGEEVRGVEISIAAQGQQARFVVASGSPLYDPGGGKLGAVVVMHDVTEQREQEADRMARAVAERANVAKSSFLAAMSHEIRTPMNGVIGLLDVLHQSSLKGNQVEMVDLIRESAFSLLTVIEDILDFSKIEAGGLEIERALTPVADVVEKVCGLVDQLAKKKGVELTLFTDPAIPEEVLGDALRLRQVLINLVNNALKFSSGQDRPGRVSVRALLAESSPERVTVEFQVADNGVGMDEKTLARLFTPFSQGDPSTTRRFGGTGLGLAISRNLVLLMGGEITVRSAPGQGSTFTVRLPFAPRQEKPDASKAKAAAEVAGLACVVVGRPEGLADDLAAYLRHGGASVERARDLATAKIQARACPPGQSVWVIDAEDALPPVDALRAAARAWPHLEVRWVVIGRGKRREPRPAASDLIVVDGNVLARQTFLKAVSTAAGRAQAESRQPVSGESSAAVTALPRKKALQQGRLILVAEDNETNQKVIRHQLDLLGYAADIVADGRAALERWRSGDYALLLTDLHMPEMDGYELTAAIRAEEKGSRRIPIVALTANVLKGEAKRCREAGMNDYLSKPAPLAELKATLEKYLPVAAETSPDRRGSPAPQTAAPAPVNVSVLEGLVGSDPEVIRELLLDFRASAAKIAAELHAACAAGDAKAGGAAAHKLKSSARSVGALALGERCAEIERAGKSKKIETLAALLPRFEAELAAVEAHLGELDKRAHE